MRLTKYCVSSWFQTGMRSRAMGGRYRGGAVSLMLSGFRLYAASCAQGGERERQRVGERERETETETESVADVERLPIVRRQLRAGW